MSSVPSIVPPADWKRYPYEIPGCDPRMFTFPAAEGDQGSEVHSYLLGAQLRGTRSGRELACLVGFACGRVARGPLPSVRQDSFLLSLFDLTAGSYGTTSAIDGPRATPLRRRRMAISEGMLDLRYSTDQGVCRWTGRRDASGTPSPFHYALDLEGMDHNGQGMSASLDVTATKPPFAVGGSEQGGVVCFEGTSGTHAYTQAGLRTRGNLKWGEFDEEVEGDWGWIEHRFSPVHAARLGDRKNLRYHYERCALHLDNGWDFTLWSQLDGERGDRKVSFSGVTAQGPEGEVRSTTDFQVERLSFVRDTGVVRPERSVTQTAGYFTDRFHLSVRDWGLSLTAEPHASLGAHAMPRDYWNGPCRFIGQMAGRPVSGFGFHERSKVWWRPHDLVFVLRETLRHMPAAAGLGVSPQTLADRVWQCDVELARGDLQAVRSLLIEQVEPGIKALPASNREAAAKILEDLLATLSK